MRAAGSSGRPATHRRSTLNTNDLRGKILRIKVKDGDITAADANKADFGTGRRVHDPGRATCSRSSPARRSQDRGRRSTRWASATRSGSRSTRTTSRTSRDYSPDAHTPPRSRGPAGVGRFEIVRKPANYGWPICYSTRARLLPVELPRVRAGHDHGGHPAAEARARRSRSTAAAPTLSTTRAGTSSGGPRHEPGLPRLPPVTDPDIWYSLPRQPRGATRSARRASATTRRRPGRSRPGSTTECPRLFPELYTGGVGPHGAAEVQLRPGQPEPEEVPAVLRRRR